MFYDSFLMPLKVIKDLFFMVRFTLSINKNDLICTNMFEIKKTFDISYNYKSKAVFSVRDIFLFLCV